MRNAALIRTCLHHGDLHRFPYSTLSALALGVAADIDEGESELQPVLELIIETMAAKAFIEVTS